MDYREKILIVEDDADINHLMRRILEKGGCQVVQAFSGTEGSLRIELERYDLVILDLMLPGMDGETLLRKIRKERGEEIPVLILSARAALADKVELLTNGADDYMTKPFEPEELLARVCAALRRTRVGRVRKKISGEERESFGKYRDSEKEREGLEKYRDSEKEREGLEKYRDSEKERESFGKYRDNGKERESFGKYPGGGRKRTDRNGEAVLAYRNLRLYPEERRIIVKGQELSLTPHEYDILTILMRSPGKVFSRETLYEQVWNGGYYGEDNTVNVHVSNIRKKIAGADPETEYIKTVWGIGFKMV